MRGDAPDHFTIRRLGLDDMDAAARIHRVAFDERLPWLSRLHTPDEDRAFFRDRVFKACDLRGAEVGGRLVGFIALREGWIDQLYVAPDAQRSGVGSALLRLAQDAQPRLRLWTFQKNALARRFYEARGFRATEETDGAGNEEKEPDVLYMWSREAGAG